MKWRRCARWLGEFGALWHSSEKFDRVGWMLASIEYSWPEKLRFNRAAERSFDLLYADLLSVNLSETVPRVEVPVFFAEGRHDRMAPVEVAERVLHEPHRAEEGIGVVRELGALPAVGTEGTVPRVPPQNGPPRNCRLTALLRFTRPDIACNAGAPMPLLSALLLRRSRRRNGGLLTDVWVSRGLT